MHVRKTCTQATSECRAIRNKTNLAFTLGFRVMGFLTGGVVTLGVFREITIILL